MGDVEEGALLAGVQVGGQDAVRELHGHRVAGKRHLERRRQRSHGNEAARKKYHLASILNVKVV